MNTNFSCTKCQDEERKGITYSPQEAEWISLNGIPRHKLGEGFIVNCTNCGYEFFQELILDGDD